MSNDKPTGVAIITFYPNKHVEVKLSTIQNITPRTLDIASNLLLKQYRLMKAKFIAESHRKSRQDKANAEKAALQDIAEFHTKEDIRRAEEAVAALPEGTEIPKHLVKIFKDNDVKLPEVQTKVKEHDKPDDAKVETKT